MSPPPLVAAECHSQSVGQASQVVLSMLEAAGHMPASVGAVLATIVGVAGDKFPGMGA